MGPHAGVAGECQHDSPILAVRMLNASLDPVSRNEKLTIGAVANGDQFIGERINRDDSGAHRQVDTLVSPYDASAQRGFR